MSSDLNLRQDLPKGFLHCKLDSRFLTHPLSFLPLPSCKIFLPCHTRLPDTVLPGSFPVTSTSCLALSHSTLPIHPTLPGRRFGPHLSRSLGTPTTVRQVRELRRTRELTVYSRTRVRSSRFFRFTALGGLEGLCETSQLEINPDGISRVEGRVDQSPHPPEFRLLERGTRRRRRVRRQRGGLPARTCPEVSTGTPQDQVTPSTPVPPLSVGRSPGLADSRGHRSLWGRVTHPTPSLRDQGPS